MKKFIKWHSQHLEFDTIKGKLVEEDQMGDLYDEEDEEGERNIRLYQTPFGTVDINDKYNPLKQFKLWVGHTNFTIGKTVTNKVKSIPGVEVFKPFTRYRFYLGVGECFDFKDVRLSVEQSICDIDVQVLNQIEDKETKESVAKLINEICVNNKWAVYVFPNGKVNYVTDQHENFDGTLEMYKESEVLSKGILITNETWKT